MNKTKNMLTSLRQTPGCRTNTPNRLTRDFSSPLSPLPRQELVMGTRMKSVEARMSPAAPPSCIDGNAPGLHLLPLRALGGLRFRCREGVVVQMSVSRCGAVQFVQSLGKKREVMVTAPSPAACDAYGLRSRLRAAAAGSNQSRRAVCFVHQLLIVSGVRQGKE